MQITPFKNTFIGTEISGINLANISDRDFSELYNAWLKFAVVRIREQNLDDDVLQTFSARFGPLEYAPLGKISDRERAQVPNPYLTTISNIVVDGRSLGGLGSGETSWHTDMSYVKHPPTASLLYALEVPDSGGDTHFCCMRKAFDVLPSDLKELISQIRIKHDAARDSIGKLRRGHQQIKTPMEAPGAVHPAILKHPETGELALFLGRRQNAYIEGYGLEASEKLLDRIWQYVAKSNHQWTQSWRVGDVVIWDNRSVMHKRDAFDATERRLMRRTQVRP